MTKLLGVAASTPSNLIYLSVEVIPLVEKKKMNLPGGDQKKKRPTQDDEPVKKPKRTVVMDDEDEEDDDDEILSDVEERGKNKNNMLYVVVGAGVIIVVIAVFLLFFVGGRKSAPADTVDPSSTAQIEETAPASSEPSMSTSSLPDDVGTQDFTQDTNMTTSATLTDPDQFVEDLYGLTTRVDYTVDKISYVADFVSYEKHRGTWGGGLELYWLDATYKNNHYVIQVPFKYYKELDDVGIVPVKMEVLTIAGSSADETLTVISYMCLDEDTLSDILKNQAKAN